MPTNYIFVLVGFLKRFNFISKSKISVISASDTILNLKHDTSFSVGANRGSPLRLICSEYSLIWYDKRGIINFVQLLML